MTAGHILNECNGLWLLKNSIFLKTAKNLRDISEENLEEGLNRKYYFLKPFDSNRVPLQNQHKLV
jgi:hypothetical protein